MRGEATWKATARHFATRPRDRPGGEGLAARLTVAVFDITSHK